MSDLPPCVHRGPVKGRQCLCHSDRFAGSVPAWRPLWVCRRPCPYLNRPNRRSGPGRLLYRIMDRLGVHRLLSRLRRHKPCGCDQRAAAVDRWWVRLTDRLRRLLTRRPGGTP